MEVETPTASPFASSLLFDYVATYMYEGDTPNAERRAAALALDRDLLRELLGQDELRELIDPDALRSVADDLQHLSDRTKAATRDELARHAPPRSATSPSRRSPSACTSRRRPRRCSPRSTTSAARSACGSAGRSAGSRPTTPACTGTRSAPCRPAACRRRSSPTWRTRSRASSPGTRARTARSRPTSCATRYRVDPSAVLAGMEASGALVRGELRPDGGTEREWCDPDVLRRLRRASLAVAAQGDRARRAAGPRGVRAVLAGRRPPSRPPAPASTGCARCSSRCRASRCPSTCGSATCCRAAPARTPRRGSTSSAPRGEVVWVGAGALGRNSGKVALYFREDAEAIGPPGRADRRAGRARARDAPRAPRAGRPASSPTCSPSSTSRRRRSRTRSGTSSGPAR